MSLRPKLSLNDYQQFGYEIYLHKAGKEYKVYIDPRSKLEVLRNGKKSIIPIRKIKVGDICNGFSVAVINKPLLRGILFLFSKVKHYPIFDLEQIKKFHEEQSTVFSREEMIDLMVKNGIQRAENMYDGVYLETMQGVDTYIPTCWLSSDKPYVDLVEENLTSSYKPEDFEVK